MFELKAYNDNMYQFLINSQCGKARGLFYEFLLNLLLSLSHRIKRE